MLITAPSLGALARRRWHDAQMRHRRPLGLPPGELPTLLFDVVNCITIRGSFVGNRGDMAEALAFAAASKVNADSESQLLSAINNVFTRLAHCDVPSRVVLEFAAA